MKIDLVFRLWPVLLLAFLPACHPKAKEVTSLQRKEAANLESEAAFAVSLRDDGRAEPLYAKAAELCPDDAGYWTNLGACRKRLGRPADARKAYESAVKAHKAAYERDHNDPSPLLDEVYVLALLGKVSDAEKVIEQAHEAHPADGRVKAFTRETLAKLMTNPDFKALAL